MVEDDQGQRTDDKYIVIYCFAGYKYEYYISTMCEIVVIKIVVLLLITW